MTPTLDDPAAQPHQAVQPQKQFVLENDEDYKAFINAVGPAWIMFKQQIPFHTKDNESDPQKKPILTPGI